MASGSMDGLKGPVMCPLPFHVPPKSSASTDSHKAPVDVTEAERIFLRSFRHIVVGPSGWAAAQQELWLACGIGNIEFTLQSFERFISCALTGSRRPLRILQVENPDLTADELALMVTVATAQAKHFTHLMALVRWLAPPNDQSRLRAAAIVLGAAMSASGLLLSARRSAAPSDFRVEPVRAPV